MPQVKFVEKHIWDIEGFEVKILDSAKKDVRSDKQLPKQYSAGRMSKNSFTVSAWKDKFKEQFPGYEIDVLKADGSKASGNTTLSKVRDSYADD